MISGLIDKVDNFEIVRDQVANFLAAESASQITFARAANRNPDNWKLRVFTERANPWDQDLDFSPVVNVWFESANFDLSQSNVMERQQANGVINIDCYGFADSVDNPEGGHLPGDQAAANEMHRAIRLVRNILMHDSNTYLGMRGVVASRWPQSISSFQPQYDGRAIQNVVGGRIVLNVSYNEFSPQSTFDALDYVAVDILRAEDGQILVEADYQYPL